MTGSQQSAAGSHQSARRGCVRSHHAGSSIRSTTARASSCATLTSPADEPYDKLKRALRAEVDEAAWSSLYSTRSRAFDRESYQSLRRRGSEGVRRLDLGSRASLGASHAGPLPQFDPIIGMGACAKYAWWKIPLGCADVGQLSPGVRDGVNSSAAWASFARRAGPGDPRTVENPLQPFESAAGRPGRPPQAEGLPHRLQ